MATEKVSTTLPAASPSQIAKNDGKGWDERAITVSYDFSCGEGENPVDVFGEKVVKHFFYKGAKVYVQSNVRRWLKAGKSDEEIQKLVSELKLEITSKSRKSPAEKMSELFKGLSKEQKIEAIKALRQQAGV